MGDRVETETVDKEAVQSLRALLTSFSGRPFRAGYVGIAETARHLIMGDVVRSRATATMEPSMHWIP